jgi:hypothetical protein
MSGETSPRSETFLCFGAVAGVLIEHDAGEYVIGAVLTLARNCLVLRMGEAVCVREVRVCL